MLSLRQLTTTSDHPQCNGLVEHFNGTLKMMLKHMCAVCFRLGLLHQRPSFHLPRGFTRKLRICTIQTSVWEDCKRSTADSSTKEQTNAKSRSTYQYVFELRNRLQDTWDLAYDALRKSQVRQKRKFDSRTKERTFKRGDMVLILLLTSDNKLLMQ